MGFDTYELVSALILFLGVMVFTICWFIFYFKSSLAKENKELKSELENLKIVNANLAKYNESLIENLKK